MKEEISALVDGELEYHKQDELLRKISRDTDLSNLWYRYHLISAAFGKESTVHAPSLANYVTESVHKTPLEHLKSPVRSTSEIKRKGRKKIRPMAIAASIMALTTFGLYVANQNFGILSVDSGVDAVAIVDRVTRWDNANPKHEDHLNALLVEHGEFTSMSGLNGLISYAKFVSYDAKE